jgi:hypothetical protein
MEHMAVQQDCRHYLGRTIASGEVVQRCRLTANVSDPFGCPEGCLFYEQRALSDAGWTQGSPTPMSNTADGLLDLPKVSKRRRKKR